VLTQLDSAGIDYCVLRGGDQLRSVTGNEEVDLLVPLDHLNRARRVLLGAGFIELSACGHAPHHFFVCYDADSDRWLKLDVVTRIAYGRPNHALETDLSDNCLKNRRPCDGVFVPSPDDEWVTLLLHCVLDKGTFSPVWQNRLRALAAEISDSEHATQLLRRYWRPEATMEEVRKDVLHDRWDELLACRRSIERRLTKSHPIRTTTAQLWAPVLRKLHRFLRFISPQAISVAILAPDGAGKSTLANGIVDHFFFPVEQIYMGLYQKKTTGPEVRATPGLGFAGKILKQWRRYLAAQSHKSRGRFVIFDRYTYDALLPSQRRLSMWQKLRRWLLANACPSPDLIVVLDAPGELLFARKGEHSADYLEQHRQAYLALQSRFPQMAVVDATRNAESVRRTVVTLMWRAFAKKLPGIT
jgi:thymidylate kinase